MAYDVIVVGSRVAGAATAMLMARAGLRVLVVDRAGFPSDTISTHQLHLTGVAALRRWGLLPRLEAAGTPATRRLRFDAGSAVLDGCYPAWAGGDALYSPRRMLLDQHLINAAQEAGAEVRQHFQVTGLVWENGRVCGIQGAERGRTHVTERARLVVGADGKRSLVARAVSARRYGEQPVRTWASYGYWSGVPTEQGGGEIYRRPGRAVAAFPTNDGLTMIYVASPAAGFTAARRDLSGHFLASLRDCGDLAERVRAGTRAERLRSTPDLPSRLVVPCGPGWALAGDAGLVMDPVLAQGISNAFRDAELLADAVSRGLGAGQEPDARPMRRGRINPRVARRGGPDPRSVRRSGLDATLAEYHRLRDQAARPAYDLTAQVARLSAPGLAERLLYSALRGQPAEISRFYGVLAGAEAADRYLSAGNLLRILARSRPRTRTPRTYPPRPTCSGCKIPSSQSNDRAW